MFPLQHNHHTVPGAVVINPLSCSQHLEMRFLEVIRRDSDARRETEAFKPASA